MLNFEKLKKRLAARLLPLNPEAIGMKIIESDYFLASIKHDGHFAILVIENGKSSLYSRSGEQIEVAQILQEAATLKKNMVLAGELCLFHDDRPTSHREVAAALANPATADLRFGVFDVIDSDGNEIEKEVKDRFELISKTLPGGKVFAIEQTLLTSRKDLIAYYQEHLKEEGIVIRSSNGIIYKVKEQIQLDLVVLGYGENPESKESRIRELLLGFALGNGRFQIVSKCGTGFSEAERFSIVEMMKTREVPSEFTEVTGAKTAFIMVKPELVVEINCLDLINEVSSGAVRKSIITFDLSGKWVSEGSFPTLSITSPVFSRFRPDKKADENDAGTKQAYSILEPLKDAYHEEALPESEIIFREVFCKKGKEGTAVRKFCGLKTKKEKSGKYSPYLAVFTDYSPGRKTPLEQEISLCKDEKELKEKIAKMKEENIKKGWEPAV
jgi:ATP-dependent DNA ligase